MATPRTTKAAANNSSTAPLVERDPIWAHLARPFEPDWIEKLPKPLKGKDDDKGKCARGTRYSADGYYCDGWHARALHLDYVGHAGITMRLNADVGPENWILEPLGTNDQGLPVYTSSQFWVRLTILGVSKIDLAEHFSSTQEAWGDAFRRAAMRFGIGTELWSKSDHAFNVRRNTEQAAEVPADAAPPDTSHLTDLQAKIGALSPEQATALKEWWGKAAIPPLRSLSPEQAKVVDGEVSRMVREAADEAAKATVTERLGATPVEEGASA